MPSGVYQRTKPPTQNQLRGLQAGRSQSVRARVRQLLKANARRPDWRLKISQATQQAMRRPEIRARHLQAIQEARKDTPNFKGGNGQAPTPEVADMARRLTPLGFVPELPIPTRGHNTGLKCPSNYKVDFGHPLRKVAVEMDGVSHRPRQKRLLDAKKTAVLKALGWRVARIIS